MNTRAYELAAIFERAFDQLNIIYKSLSTNNSSKTNNEFQLSNIDLNDINPLSFISDNSSCDQFAPNLSGIFVYEKYKIHSVVNLIYFRMNEHDKFRAEIRYVFHLLILLFRALISESQTNFLTIIDNINRHLLSRKLIELNNHLINAQDKIKKLSFTKNNFQTEQSQQINRFSVTKLHLKDRFMEENFRSKLALNYCNQWKKNHILQWIQMLLEIEQNYVQTIDQYENILKQTNTIHKETIEILRRQNTEVKLSVNKLYERYQDETKRFEKELNDFRQEFHQLKQRKQAMYEGYHRMKIAVDEYNRMKIHEKFILEKEKQQEEAIERIQAWWRGTMTRHIKRKKKRKSRKK